MSFEHLVGLGQWGGPSRRPRGQEEGEDKVIAFLVMYCKNKVILFILHNQIMKCGVGIIALLQQLSSL